MGKGGDPRPRNRLLACQSARIKCSTGGTRASPAGVGPHRTVREAGPCYEPGDGRPFGGGTSWAGSDTRKGQYRGDHKARRPEDRSRQQKTYHSNQIWPEIFEVLWPVGGSFEEAGCA